MKSQEVTVMLKEGLAAQPACAFIQEANQYKKCQIHIEYKEQRVNAKSLLGILSLGIQQGNKFTLIADGEQEEEALAALADKLV